MSVPRLDELYRRAHQRKQEVPVVAAGGEDITVLHALGSARKHGWARPLITGRADAVRRVAAEHRMDLDGFTLLDADDPAAAVREVRAGRARLLMKGAVDTPALMRAILDPLSGLRTGRTICQVVLMDVLRSARCFLMADTGVCIQPTLEQKDDILRHTLEVAHTLGAAEVKVAVMAATEKVTEAMPETLDAQELSRRSYPGAAVQGPLSFDLAYSPHSAGRKHVEGPVVGDADVMLFPNLVSANLTVKAMMYTANCRFGGVLCGTSCPVVFMSRSDSTATRLNSLALALALL
jgi:phosphate butyryltransferase